MINSRANASSKYGVATINGVNGLVLLPDNWTLPSDVGFTSGVAKRSGSTYFQTVNSYSAEEWEKMEANGAVFLPAAGNRYGTRVEIVGEACYYWSSSMYSNGEAHAFAFNSMKVYNTKSNRAGGSAVRLVKDAN